MKLNTLIKWIAFIVIVALLIYAYKSKTTSPTGENVTNLKSLDVEFYVMSQCPFGLQVESGIKPILDKFGDTINFKLEFVGLEKDGEFQSLHGQTELDGNKVQLCAQEHESEKFLEMILCMNEEATKIPDNWEDCAKDLELNIEKITECYEGEEGNNLLKETFKKANEKKVQGSPTMYFNDELYTGDRDEDSFTRAVCRKLEHNLCEDVPVCAKDSDCPAKDSKIPLCENAGTAEAKCSEKEDVRVDAILLTSKQCPDCDISEALQQLKTIFLNLEGKQVDIDTEEGKQLAEKYGIEKLPIIFLSKSLKETFIWEKQGDQIKEAFVEKDDIFLIKPELTNAHFFVDADKRKEYYEKLGITFGDNKPQIDFFVMSYCPYGDIAEEAIAPVYDLLKGKAEFNPHYVIYSDYQGGGEQFCIDEEDKYCAMHGAQEMSQGLRELCVAKHLGMDAYFEYVIAMNEKSSYKNADEKWEEVAKEIGLDTAKIKKCFETEADEILAEELKLNKAFGAKGSPQVFIDGNAYSSGRDPESFKQALCNAFNDAPTECDTKLGTTQAAASGSCS